ncbi:MAG: response regulator [Magnetococcales bacterium]|nr:response regulator [Magnetococcales bacterium]
MTTRDTQDRQTVVLVIDDEQYLRDTFRKYLEHLQYVVLVAENGRTGLALFAREKPDLVLTDLRMPDMDGLAVLTKIRNDSPDTPVIIVSGKGEVDDVIGALRLGAWDYLSKPLDSLLVLGHVVAKAMERFHLIQENRAYQTHLEEEVASRTSALQKANQAKSDFLATISHEIRTPINVVLGLTGVLLETELTAEQRRYAETMHHSGGALLSLLNDVLDFSRIDAGCFTLNDSPIFPCQIVEETANLMRISAEEKGLTLAVTVTDDIPAMVLGDGVRLRQVLLNVLGNAIKFTHLGKIAVCLTTHPQEPGALLFRISDTGIGVAAEYQQAIFDKFFQVDKGITRRYGGTGLGLAISRRLVETMGGRMWMESEEGQGSTFFFTMPIRIAAAPSMPATLLVTPPVQEETLSLRILLVEDALDNQMLFATYLKKTPHHLVIANNGLEAVERVQAASFDLVLMDLQMPVMDGYTATRIMRKLEQDAGRAPLIILALSAHASQDKKEESLAAGCNDHLTKPIRRQALLEVIQQVGERIVASRSVPQRP